MHSMHNMYNSSNVYAHGYHRSRSDDWDVLPEAWQLDLPFPVFAWWEFTNWCEPFFVLQGFKA